MSSQGVQQQPQTDQQVAQQTERSGPAAAALGPSNSEGQDQLERVSVEHRDFTWGQLEEVQGQAEAAERAPTDGLYDEVLALHTQIPLEHTDALLARCDVELARTMQATALVSRVGDDERRLELQEEFAREQTGRSQIRLDQIAFVRANNGVGTVATALGLLRDSNQYTSELVRGLECELGSSAVIAMLESPLRAEDLAAIDDNVGGAALDAESLGSVLGSDPEGPTPLLRSAAREVELVQTGALDAVLALETASMAIEAALLGQDAAFFAGEVARIQSERSGYEEFHLLLKIGVAFVTKNWAKVVEKAVDGLIGQMGRHQEAIFDGKAKAAEVAASQLEGLEAWGEADRAFSALRDLGNRSAAVGEGYRRAEREVAERRDNRRSDLLTLGAQASDHSTDGATSGDLGARLMLAGALMESVALAQGVRAVITSSGVTPDDLAQLQERVAVNRETNPIQELHYTWQTADAPPAIGAWSWVHPGEIEALQELHTFVSLAQASADAFLDRLGPAAQQAAEGLSAATHDHDLEY